jgi:hypothetical protein
MFTAAVDWGYVDQTMQLLMFLLGMQNVYI